MPSLQPSTQRRRSNRSNRAELNKQRKHSDQQLPFQQFQYPYPPTEIASQEIIERIHNASIKILKELGIVYLHDGAREKLKQAGAKVIDKTVFMDEDFVNHHLQTAPSAFTLHARNPAHNLRIGDNYVAFTSVASAPNSHDRQGGRRTGNFNDYCNFLRLGQQLNTVHMFGGYPVEPIDLPVATRHLHAIKAFIELTDKPFHAYSLGAERILDALEITARAFSITMEDLKQKPVLFSVINTNSPLQLDTPMLDGLMAMAEYNQPVAITPFTLSGAMAPATIAGALSLQNAEALSGIVMTQVTNPGAPVLYGGFTSNVDMKSGSPAFGTPEYIKSAQIGGQLARYYNIPFRSSNVNAANTLDAQSAWESAFSLQGALGGQCNMLMHGAGWMEGGLVASFEKMVMDAELLGYMQSYYTPLSFEEEDFGFEAIKSVGPGGHFFGCEHTLARYENAFHTPLLADWRNNETWLEADSPTTFDHAEKRYQSLLENYQQPNLEISIKESIEEYISKREAAGGAPTL
jgi:trimethylamine--corrinoid protein Co-methyltransferase